MDNQQPKVSGEDLGWLAGFFDGEGSVCLTIRPSAAKNGGPKVQPQAMLGSTDTAALDKAHDILARADIGHHISWQRPHGVAKNGNAYREAWSIKMVGLKRAKAFLSWVMPVLATKQERAALALIYIASREMHTDFRTPITEYEWSLAMKMKELNSRTTQHFSAVKLNTERPGASHEALSSNGMKGAVARWGNRN
ncbi:MAG: hypothetical protein WC359_14065 [Dehalococcoidia bacterium]